MSADVARIRRRHFRRVCLVIGGAYEVSQCDACTQSWPCDATQLADQLAALRERAYRLAEWVAVPSCMFCEGESEHADGCAAGELLGILPPRAAGEGE